MLSLRVGQLCWMKMLAGSTCSCSLWLTAWADYYEIHSRTIGSLLVVTDINEERLSRARKLCTEEYAKNTFALQYALIFTSLLLYCRIKL